MSYIKKSDFKGNIKISQNVKETNDLSLYIQRNFKNYLLDFIGANQYSIYINQLDSVGISTLNKYKTLITGLDNFDNQFKYYSNDKVICLYDGILIAIRYFIFWDYVRNLNAKATSVGIRFADAENSVGSSQLQTNNVIEQRYNLGVESFNDACLFLNKTYDSKVYFDNIVNNNDGTFTILIKDIKGKNSLNYCSLIDEGDTIELDAIDYIVEQMIFGTGPDSCLITISADETTTFEDSYFHINPFVDFVCSHKKLSVLDGMF